MSESKSGIQRGFLVLADISGYTAFLSKAELEHAQEILTDLLETIVDGFRSLLTIHKIEGDAVFGYAGDGQLVRGETLLELIESTYIAFRGRTKNVRRHTDCGCRACSNIGSLDLKFIVHHGEFAVQSIGGRPELAGSDVNLAHRLLKNHVSEQTGWSAYALFSKPGLVRTGLQLPGIVDGTEEYEHLGIVPVCSLDLHERYETLMSQRHVVVDESNAMASFSDVIRATPAVLWDWLNEPSKRKLYTHEPGGLEFKAMLRPNGRTGAGATTHCVHGKNTAMRETVLDWKPFDYFTVEQDSGVMGVIRVTFRFEPVDADHTRLAVFFNGRLKGVPGFLQKPMIRLIYLRLFQFPTVVSKLKELVEAPPQTAAFPSHLATPAAA
jgi:hypothetical protein